MDVTVLVTVTRICDASPVRDGNGEQENLEEVHESPRDDGRGGAVNQAGSNQPPASRRRSLHQAPGRATEWSHG